MKNLLLLGILGVMLIGPLDAKNLRASIGDHPQDVTHSIYTGTYGNAKGTFVLQWMGERVRGAFFNEANTYEVRLYGDNSVQGKVSMEAWRQGKLVGKGTIRKEKFDDQLAWGGKIRTIGAGDIRLVMFKYASRRGGTVTSTSSYSGTLGKTSVRVKLNWYSNGKVRGRYTNLNTKKSYDIYGYNYANGKLYLDEWDESSGDIEGGQISARVSLRKVTTSGRVHWVGRMFNMDGRNFVMNFTKTRAR
jgi:hypothetical protein